MAYYVLDTESTEEVHLRKMASNLRQQGLKCLSSVFEFVGNAFDWSTSMEDIYAVVVKPRISHFRMKTYNNPPLY
ncbi:BEM_collapsed_G0002010.mRNA.1.CDS.1 [Saccharomyces cerevisiae]|nr:BEM_collapsed_G0002010.mRNA.1.CDS.1 [Saccharomyces cerevisiae]